LAPQPFFYYVRRRRRSRLPRKVGTALRQLDAASRELHPLARIVCGRPLHRAGPPPNEFCFSSTAAPSTCTGSSPSIHQTAHAPSRRDLLLDRCPAICLVRPRFPLGLQPPRRNHGPVPGAEKSCPEPDPLVVGIYATWHLPKNGQQMGLLAQAFRKSMSWTTHHLVINPR